MAAATNKMLDTSLTLSGRANDSLQLPTNHTADKPGKLDDMLKQVKGRREENFMEMQKEITAQSCRCRLLPKRVERAEKASDIALNLADGLQQEWKMFF